MHRILAVSCIMAMALPGVPGLAATPATAQAAIQAVLDASAVAWNAGDLDRFMTCYENQPTTSYVSGQHYLHGYAAIKAMYGARFGGGSKPAMGRLSLEILEFRPFGQEFAYVIGRFHLDRDPADGGPLSGPTTLLFRRSQGEWHIIADHS